MLEVQVSPLLFSCLWNSQSMETLAALGLTVGHQQVLRAMDPWSPSFPGSSPGAWNASSSTLEAAQLPQLLLPYPLDPNSELTLLPG